MDTKKKTSNRFSPEVRDRAVRLVLEHQGGHASQWAAIASIAAKIGCTGAVRDAISRTIVRLPEQLRRSLTWEQGAEMAQHPRLRIDTGQCIYFCDPHSPWQRGTNENTNGLLRQYFPKGTDLGEHSAEALEAVAHPLNTDHEGPWIGEPAEALNAFIG